MTGGGKESYFVEQSFVTNRFHGEGRHHCQYLMTNYWFRLIDIQLINSNEQCRSRVTQNPDKEKR